MTATTPRPDEAAARRPGARVLRRLALLFAALSGGSLILALAFPALRHPGMLVSLAAEEPARTLPVPVEGVAARDLRDTWGAARSGGRRHQGIDIFARRGTPVRSATRGIVVTVGTNRLGGRIVRVLGPGLEWHYYAHLDGYGEFAPGELVDAGDVLGFVGDTGNARGTPPHLHYGIYDCTGCAGNPFPRLAPEGPVRSRGQA
jgi:murein DD-endopeptidase MepM/ murein hydrolase activator NlpD